MVLAAHARSSRGTPPRRRTSLSTRRSREAAAPRPVRRARRAPAEPVRRGRRRATAGGRGRRGRVERGGTGDGRGGLRRLPARRGRDRRPPARSPGGLRRHPRRGDLRYVSGSLRDRRLAAVPSLRLARRRPRGLSRAVVELGAAGWPQRASEFQVRPRLVVAPLVAERSPERIVRVVVGRGQLEHLAKLGLGLLPALDPEVGDAERLADGRLLGLEPLRLLERNGGLCGHAAAEVRAALLEEVVRVAHRAPSGLNERSESAAWTRRSGVSRAAAADRIRPSSVRARSADPCARGSGPYRASAIASVSDRTGMRRTLSATFRSSVGVASGSSVTPRSTSASTSSARTPAARRRASPPRNLRSRRARFAPTTPTISAGGARSAATSHHGTVAPSAGLMATWAAGALGDGCRGVKSRNRPVPSARTASAESDASVYTAESVPRPGVGSNASHP